MKKKTEITLLNVIMCLVVIYIHISSEIVVTLDKAHPLYMFFISLWRLTSFVVPGFIMLSGIKMFLKYKNEEFNVLKFYRSRLTSILIPYIIWVIIYFVYEYLKGERVMDFNNLFFCLYSGEIGSHLYFIVALIQFYILMPLWIKIFKKTNPAFMLPFFYLISTIFGRFLPNIIDIYIRGYYYTYADRIFTQYLFWWAIGCYIGLYYDKFIEILKRHTVFVLITNILSSAMLIYCAYLRYKKSFFLSMEAEIQVLHTLSTLMLLYRIMLFMKDFRISENKLIKRIDNASFYIYLSHILVLKEVTYILNKNNISDLWIRYGIKALFVYVLTIGICILYTEIKKKFKHPLH